MAKERFMETLIPIGYADIRKAVETAIEAGHDGSWAAEKVQEFMDDTGCQLVDSEGHVLDVCYVVYDALLQEARADIESCTGTDILNDTNEQIEVYGNFVCTSLDYSEGATTELAKILATISDEDYTDAIKWLIRETEIEDEIEEIRNEDQTEDCEECGKRVLSAELEANGGVCAECDEARVQPRSESDKQEEADYLEQQRQDES